jgi:tripartite-type tricarboxylate transporter receptor subunit TctC
MRRLLRAAAAAVVAMVVCVQALAQDYPTRAITVIVPYPPGGGVDAMARVVAEKLSAALGQQVVVDNRAGGSGLVGTRAFIKSPPDGYTLFLGHTGSISINPSLYANAGFDPRKDFAPIGLIASMPVVLLAHPSLPAKTIGEVVAIAKQARAKFNIGTSAVGTGGYLTAELFKSVTGVDAAIIPYKGTAQVMNDLLGNHVPIAFGVLPPALGIYKPVRYARSRCSAPRGSASCRMCRPQTSRGCPDLNRSCITGCLRRRERRGRSSSVSTARYVLWPTAMKSSSASWPKAAIR